MMRKNLSVLASNFMISALQVPSPCARSIVLNDLFCSRQTSATSPDLPDDDAELECPDACKTPDCSTPADSIVHNFLTISENAKVIALDGQFMSTHKCSRAYAHASIYEKT